MSILSALWSSAATLAAPMLQANLRARARRGKEIRERLAERIGQDATPRPTGTLIWIHAASVGESVSILPVLAALARASYESRVLLTTGTVSSATLLAQRLPELGLQDYVTHRFAPLDVPRWAATFLDHWLPDVAAFVESELWPNLLAACRARQIPCALLNGRMSPRSFARWRRAGGLARDVLGCFTTITAQSSGDAERFAALGARDVLESGNLKFAATPLPVNGTEFDRLRAAIGARPCWVAASIHPAEEAAIIATHQRLSATWPGLVTIVVPRHPDRGPAIASQATAAGLFAGRRDLGACAKEATLWIADTLGELGLWYRLAGIAFVGRSLALPGGGQNPLEPARLGCVVAVGPHTANFVEAVQTLRAAGGLTEIADAASLARWVGSMLADPEARAAGAARAAAAAQRYDDLPDRLAAALLAMARGRRA